MEGWIIVVLIIGFFWNNMKQNRMINQNNEKNMYLRDILEEMRK